MELTNTLYLYSGLGDKQSKETLEVVLQLLSPFAPHMTEELWHRLGHKDLISMAPWPTADPSKMSVSELEIVIQVNGKLREKVKIGAGTAEKDVKSKAMAALEKRGLKINPKRVIYVPNKLVNFVG